MTPASRARQIVHETLLDAAWHNTPTGRAAADELSRRWEHTATELERLARAAEVTT
jgi:hypothetical protein